MLWTVRVDRSGREQPLDFPPRSYVHLQISPDGRRVAVDTYMEQDIWIYEIGRETMSRLTSRHTSLHPIWTADGASVILMAKLVTPAWAITSLEVVLDWTRELDSSVPAP